MTPQFRIGQVVWLIYNNQKDCKLVIVSLDPFKCRFPDGHIEEVFPDEVIPA